MHGAALEEQQVAWGEFRLDRRILHPESAAPRENEEIFVTSRMVVRRRWLVDAEDASAGGRSVGQVTVDQECGGGRRKASGDRRHVEAR